MSSLKGKKTALVLSGGAVKAGAWHIGVALALEELGYTLKHNESPKSPDLEISTYVGSSAGALVNLLFASGFSPKEINSALTAREKGRLKTLTYLDILRLKGFNQNINPSKKYKPFLEFPTVLRHLLKPILKISGIFTTEGLKSYIKDNVIHSDKYEDYEADLFVIASQLDDSKKVVFSKYNYPSPIYDQTSVYHTQIPIADSVAASMSIPPIYCPFPIRDPNTNKVEYYIDGEIRDTLSSHVAVDNKCDVMICSWTHSPYHFNEEVGSLIHYGLPAICIQSLYLMLQRKIIAQRNQFSLTQDAINTLNRYMKDNKFSQKDRKNITSILEEKLQYQPNAVYIDIFPDHSDYEIFMTNHFSLHKNQMSLLASRGYERTMKAFAKYESSL